jgi:spore coat polysaccharide biosynthesis protein SpsF
MPMSRNLIAALACRNNGSRLYGKPLQYVDVKNQVSILDNIVASLKKNSNINEIVLGISEGIENEIYIEIANNLNIKYIIGDQDDVLSRLIMCGVLAGATDIFRVTSESPFRYFERDNEIWNLHVKNENDATFLDEIVDGCGSEIISLDALKISHARGDSRHRSEMCSLYIREHPSEFKVQKIYPENKFIRRDLRLTVDNPEDLILCREVYVNFKDYAPDIPLEKIIEYLDINKHLKDLTFRYTEIGYSSMYI